MKEKIKAYYVADDIDEVLNYVTNLQQERDKYKSIVEELKKYLEEDGWDALKGSIVTTLILRKIKELEEGNSNEDTKK